MICLKISIFVVSNTTISLRMISQQQLWFAWKFLSLWYQTQPLLSNFRKISSCDLLENFYLCGIKHNWFRFYYYGMPVVICLKISIFVVSNTTLTKILILFLKLWFAWKFLSLWYQTQRLFRNAKVLDGCDLLENFYLCGIKHNEMKKAVKAALVVICLKISIFVVSNTTSHHSQG